MDDRKGIKPVKVLLQQFPKVSFVGPDLTWSNARKSGEL